MEGVFDFERALRVLRIKFLKGSDSMQPEQDLAPVVLALADRVEALEAARAEQQQQQLLGMTTTDLFVVLSGIHDMDRMNVARHLMRHPRIGPALRGAQQQAATEDSSAAEEDWEHVKRDAYGLKVGPRPALFELQKRVAAAAAIARTQQQAATEESSVAEPGTYVTALRVARDALRQAGDEGRAALLVVEAALLDDTEPVSPLPAPAPAPEPTPAPPAKDIKLVERLAWLLAKVCSESRPGTDCTPFAREVLQTVANAALLNVWDAPMAEKLTWHEVSHWLQQEATR